jgi:hypothetical protein
MLRISTAQRTKARSFGSRGKISPAPREPVGHDDLDIARGRDQAGGIERIVALMQLAPRDGCKPLRLRSP